MIRRQILVAAIAGLLTAPILLGGSHPAAGHWPSRLTDPEFMRLIEDLSEPDGQFLSENFASNEMVFARIVPELVARTKPGSVYVGVGPEQNFTYIAAMQPVIAFITDIRRGNLQLHLMYKAAFELSEDRAGFLSLLFTRARPVGATASYSAADLMAAYGNTPREQERAYEANLASITNQLTNIHGWRLSAGDLAGIAGIYRVFYDYGPAVNYSANAALPPPRGGWPSYSDLMSQVDGDGRGLSYLASEIEFRAVRQLEVANLLVPVVGNFAGPKTLRALGTYVRSHDSTVGAFYVSNVEQYLTASSTLRAFCANVAAMPLDETSVFIRPRGSPLDVALRTPPTPVTSVRNTASNAPFGGAVTDALRFEPNGVVPMAKEIRACSAEAKGR